MIKDILLDSNHITLNTNTPTRLPPNQTQQPASADCTSWRTIHSLTSDYLPLLTTHIIHYKTKTTHSHFTKTITNYQKADWTSFKQHVEKLISCKLHSTSVHVANKHFIEAILDANRLFIPKGNHNSTNHTHPCISTSLSIIITIFTNKTDQTHKSLLLNNHINKQRHEHKTNNWKQNLYKIDHKHNPHSLWGTIAKLSNKKTPRRQNRSICFGS